MLPSAKARILRDYKELCKNPISNIRVQPTENIQRFLMSFKQPEDNVKVKESTFWEEEQEPEPEPDSELLNYYDGIIFHGEILFPDNYPSNPPRIKLKTYIPHPNIYRDIDHNANIREKGIFICLNMLRLDMNSSYGGWSSAYTLETILVNLVSFIFDDNIAQDSGSSSNSVTDTKLINKARIDALEFHREYQGKYDTFPVFDEVIKIYQKTSSEDLFTVIPDEVLCIIFYNSDFKEIYSLSRTCKVFNKLIQSKHIMYQKELVCFHSKKHFTETNLGIGINRENLKNNQFKLNADMDLLSKEAFSVDKVTTGVWRNKFNYWIPVLFDEDDCDKSLKDLELSIFKLNYSLYFTGPPNQKFNPLIVLNIIPKLINNTVTKLMNDHDYYQHLTCKNSEKLMVTFTRLQYIFMFLATKHPVIVEKTKEKVGLFRKNSCYRNKIVVPDLGEFLTYLYLCPSLVWKEIKEDFLKSFVIENFTRQVLFMARKNSRYLNMHNSDKLKYGLSLQETSLKIVLFQVFFLNDIVHSNELTLEEKVKEFQNSYGKPKKGTVKLLYNFAKDIQHIDSWNKYFKLLKLPVPNSQSIINLLNKAIQSSEDRGYYPRITKRSTYKYDINDKNYTYVKISGFSKLGKHNSLDILQFDHLEIYDDDKIYEEDYIIVGFSNIESVTALANYYNPEVLKYQIKKS